MKNAYQMSEKIRMIFLSIIGAKQFASKFSPNNLDTIMNLQFYICLCIIPFLTNTIADTCTRMDVCQCKKSGDIYDISSVGAKIEKKHASGIKMTG